MQKRFSGSHLLIRFIISVLTLFGSGGGLFAWGPGHDDINRIALDRLPADIKTLLSAEDRKAFVKESHAPDDFTPWAEYERKKGRPIAPQDLVTLSSHDINTPYALHSAKGQAVNFILLHRALKDRDGSRIAFWGACLAHTLADEAACNHDPLVHYLTYAFKGGYGMTFGEAGMLDFGELCRTPQENALVMETLGEQLPNYLSEEPQEALAEIMMHGLKANQFMTERGVRIASAFNPEVTDDVLENSRLAMAELGAHAVKASLGAITTAWALINEGKPDPKITPELLAEHKIRHEKFVAARPLAADALYAPWLQLQADADVPAVGVVVEPSISMNQGGLSFGGRFLASAIFRELQESKIPFRVIDAREPDRSLSVKSTSMVILCSGGLRHEKLVHALGTYTDAGGNLLLIGGEHRGLLGPLSQALTKADPGTLPVSSGYGEKNVDIIDAIKVRFSGPLAEEIGEKAFHFIHNPDTSSGWQKPKCPYQLKEELGEEIEPLAKIELDGQSRSVAAVYRPDEMARFVFIPEYLIAPYLLTDEPAFTNPAQPQLDRVGSAVVSGVLRLLR
ncbi:MAG: hypothetical protein AAGH89_02290 [Verrucomicrobiota bacterium]